MMAIQRHPMESALSLALDPPARPWRLSRTSTLVMGGVVLLHLGLGAYLYTTKMSALHEAPTADRPIIVTTINPPKPPPPPHEQPKQQQQQTQAPIHKATMVDFTPQVQPLVLPQTPVKTLDPKAEIAPTKADPGPTVIQNPDWVSRPTGLQMTRYYPEAAMENSVSGRVVLSCSVTASGGVSNCQVMSETPTGQGFAAAALKLAGFFKLSPRTENGKAIDGALVRIPLVFNAGD